MKNEAFYFHLFTFFLMIFVLDHFVYFLKLFEFVSDLDDNLMFFK
jgi:hypothetical protein